MFFASLRLGTRGLLQTCVSTIAGSRVIEDYILPDGLDDVCHQRLLRCAPRNLHI
jgi:hypothetical protein